MRIGSIITAALAAAVLSTVSASAAEPISAERLNDPFDEVYRPEVQVSGNVIVGVMSATAQDGLASDRLTVASDPAVGGVEVCLRATSNDGIYSSRNHYRIPDTALPVAVRLPYASGMEDVLAGYEEGQIAISVAAGDCAANAGGTYLVASSGDGNAEDPVLIYLNSFGATDVFVQTGSDGAPQPCTYLSQGRRTTYDFICTLAPTRSEAGSGGRQVTIIRERFGREQPAVVFQLVGR
jgi:hypothetical protein